MRGSRMSRAQGAFSGGEDVNPMEGLANLADAMLVLAVGIMLALVVAWNVDITSTAPADNSTAQDEYYDVEGVLGSASEDADQTIDINDLFPYDGTVYVDEDGNFYVMEEKGE